MLNDSHPIRLDAPLPRAGTGTVYCQVTGIQHANVHVVDAQALGTGSQVKVSAMLS